jgi:hypothetical protein
MSDQKDDLDTLRRVCEALPKDKARAALLDACNFAYLAGQAALNGDVQTLGFNRKMVMQGPVNLALVDPHAWTPVVSDLFVEIIEWMAENAPSVRVEKKGKVT